MALFWVAAGFAAFGVLVGTTAGLSTAELTITLLGLLFALIGGSIGALLGKLDTSQRKLAGAGLLTFSISALVGLYSGIFVRINDLLRIAVAPPAAAIQPAKQVQPGAEYLKSGAMQLPEFLALQIQRQQMALPDACRMLAEQGGGAGNK